jgi:hypothetical protein
MPVEPITITVTFSNGILSVEPGKEQITIGPGDAVQWIFIGTPDDCLAFIHFETEGHERFGPFQYREPAATGLIAMGNSGILGTYGYTALILGDEEAVATTTASLAIVNTSAVLDTTPHLTVSYHPDAVLPNEKVVVDPDRLLLEQGRTAIWNIFPENIPSDHFVTFHFDLFPATPMTGPFQSFSLSPAPDGSLVARGENFSATDQVPYHVRIRDAQGRVVGAGDPVIEPLESPPGH